MNKFSIEESKDGYEIIKVQNGEKSYYIGSKYNQKREIKKFIDSCGIFTENDIYILWGMINKEGIEELLKKKISKTPIIVIETNDELIDIMNKKIKLHLKDIVYLNEENIHFINKYIFEENIEYVKNITFGNYNKIFKSEILNMYSKIKKRLQAIRICRNTRQYFDEKWLQGDINNARFIPQSIKLDELKNKYRNKPAVIVSAGPSLQKNIKDLEKNKAYIISGGRTLKSLLNINIDPDIVNIVDAGEISYNLVEEYIEKTKSTLVYSEMTNYKIVEKHKGNKIVTSQTGIIKRMYDYNIENIVRGGSVANSMAYIAGIMGFNPIIFIGQDLAYTDDKGHSEIANYKNETVDGEEKYFRDSDVYIDDINGNKIRTSIVLKSFKDAMESIIKIFPDTTFIDATEGGALIKGTKVKTLKEAMNEYGNIIKEKVGNECFDEELYKKLKKYIENSKIDIERVREICTKGIVNIGMFKTMYFSGKNIENINKELDKIDVELRKRLKRLDMLNNAIYPFIFKLKNEEKFVINNEDTEKMIIEKKLNLNSEIYNGMIQICDRALNEIEKAYKDY